MTKPISNNDDDCTISSTSTFRDQKKIDVLPMKSICKEKYNVELPHKREVCSTVQAADIGHVDISTNDVHSEDTDTFTCAANNASSSCEVADEYIEIEDLATAGNGCAEEHLRLSFTESYFLSYGLGCLFVKDTDGTVLDLMLQWKTFCLREPRFPLKYAAYHHFRGKGWVPRDGIRYGSDFVLYRKGPSFYHASYIVVLQTVDAETLEPIEFNGVPNRNFSWVTLSGLLRMATTVSKEVMFCYILVPREFAEKAHQTPECLKMLSVQEKIVSRWTSNKEKERELIDIDCHF